MCCCHQEPKIATASNAAIGNGVACAAMVGGACAAMVGGACAPRDNGRESALTRRHARRIVRRRRIGDCVHDAVAGRNHRGNAA